MQIVGLIGAGIMGTPMTRTLLRGGYTVNVFDTNKEHVAALVADGAVAKNSAKEVGEASDVIITMLPNSKIVEAVMFGENGLYQGLSKGKIYVDMSSSDYASNQMISEKLKAIDVPMLDAPVTGSVKGAEEGTLTIMVGGAAETLEQVRPVLETLGSKLIHVGPIGSADIAKACNQLLFAMNTAAVSEVMALSAKAGLDPAMLMTIVSNGSGESYAGRVKTVNFTFKRNFKPGFTVNLMAKDVDIALNMARNLQVPLKLGTLVRENLRVAQNKGYALDDCSSVARLIEEDADVVIQPFADKEN